MTTLQAGAALQLGDVYFPGGGIHPGMAVQVWVCEIGVMCGEVVDPADGVPRRLLGVAAGTGPDGGLVAFEVYARPACRGEAGQRELTTAATPTASST